MSIRWELLNEVDERSHGGHFERRPDVVELSGIETTQNGEDFGPNENIVPKQSDILRARDIMRALRSRSNDRQRPKIELDYLKRLLDGLF